MKVEVTITFAHTIESLPYTIEAATGHKPTIKLLGNHNNINQPVYLCEFDIDHEHDQKILTYFKKENVKIGEVIPSPPKITEDHSSLRHQTTFQPAE